MRLRRLFESSSQQFYHGTVMDSVSSIMLRGLKNPCLTTVPEIAQDYAEAQGGDEVVVLAVRVHDTSKLRVDYPSLLEPVGFGSVTGAEMDAAVRRMYDQLWSKNPQWRDDGNLRMGIPDTAWRHTLKVTRTVMYHGVIPPKNLSIWGVF